LLRHWVASVFLVVSSALLYIPNPREARTAIIEITTSSSTRVNPRRVNEVGSVCFMIFG
jgi:hypothetical protein